MLFSGTADFRHYLGHSIGSTIAPIECGLVLGPRFHRVCPPFCLSTSASPPAGLIVWDKCVSLHPAMAHLSTIRILTTIVPEKESFISPDDCLENPSPRSQWYIHVNRVFLGVGSPSAST
ncbi:Protein of unknown function [Gryllus bimaculatus]|nr:Protein of unknown function [Gryllus bimaculatus]